MGSGVPYKTVSLRQGSQLHFFQKILDILQFSATSVLGILKIPTTKF